MRAAAGRSQYAPGGAVCGDSSFGRNAGEDLAVRQLSWNSRDHIQSTLGLAAGGDRRARAKTSRHLNKWRTVAGAPLAEVARLMRDAAFFAGNDSGPAHVAAAFGVPQVVFFGPSDSEVWAPWQTPAEVLKAEGAINSITRSEPGNSGDRAIARGIAGSHHERVDPAAEIRAALLVPAHHFRRPDGGLRGDDRGPRAADQGGAGARSPARARCDAGAAFHDSGRHIIRFISNISSRSRFTTSSRLSRSRSSWCSRCAAFAITWAIT